MEIGFSANNPVQDPHTTHAEKLNDFMIIMEDGLISS